MLFGKDLYLSNDQQIEFTEEMIHPEPEVNYLRDVIQVFNEKINEVNDQLLYYVYRRIYNKEDEQLFLESGVSYDLLVLLSGKVGQEYYKTRGHFHVNKPNMPDAYPEFYEVLSGEAILMLQKNSRSGEVEEIMAVEAQTNDIVYIPPGYGHVIINSTDQPLVVGSLLASKLKYVTEPFIVKNGAAFYYIEMESGRADFIKNPNYHNSVGLQVLAAPNMMIPFELDEEKNLYDNYVHNPEKFSILK
jgi:glucose-6-phosphate isomerase